MGKEAVRIVCYIPMLEGQTESVRAWMDDLRERYDVIPVLLEACDWNTDLTPWPAEPVFRKGKAFGGKAATYLEKLENETIPSLEAEMGIVPDERWLIGVSLSGLFSVWASARSPLFARVASISGSFWYPGFVEWLRGQAVSARAVYLSLGDRESEGKNPRLKAIASQTAEVVRILESQGIPTRFEWTEGTHFGPVVPRMERALKALYASLR